MRGSRHPAGADTVMMTMVRKRIKRMATMVRRVWWVKAIMVKRMVRIKTMVTMGMSIEMMRRNPRFENGIPGFA